MWGQACVPLPTISITVAITPGVLAALRVPSISVTFSLCPPFWLQMPEDPAGLSALQRAAGGTAAS